MKKKIIVAVKVLVGICTVGTCTKPWYDHTIKNKIMNTKTPHNNTTQQHHTTTTTKTQNTIERTTAHSTLLT